MQKNVAAAAVEPATGDAFWWELPPSLSALQEYVAGLVRGDTAEMIASLTGYSYLVEAAHAISL